jgi:hypothetical protein
MQPGEYSFWAYLGRVSFSFRLLAGLELISSTLTSGMDASGSFCRYTLCYANVRYLYFFAAERSSQI